MTAPLGWYEDGGAAALGTPIGIVLGVLLALAWHAAALGAPPEHTDPALAPWFQQLKQPETGIGCCSISDCRVVDYRATGAQYEALIPEDLLGNVERGEPAPGKGRWVLVPPERVLKNEPNPTGRGVACYVPSQGILCFVSATET